MKRNRVILPLILPLLLVLLTFAAGIHAAALQSSSQAPPTPLRVELAQKHDSTPIWLQVLDKVAWPAIVIIAIIIFRTPIHDLLNAFSKPGADISIGSVAFKIPALESRLEIQSLQLQQQKGQLDQQSEQIRNLVKFSMAWYIYKMLFDIKKAQTTNGEYVYKNDGSMDRNLHFLIDHGYVQEVYPWPGNDEEISRRVTLTASGQDLIAMRGPA
jgi:hypothetical protein